MLYSIEEFFIFVNHVKRILTFGGVELFIDPSEFGALQVLFHLLDGGELLCLDCT